MKKLSDKIQDFKARRKREKLANVRAERTRLESSPNDLSS